MSNPSTVNTETEKVVNTNYIGRFAPSPTGPLHFGSLLAALASFLDARANHGLWLVRIEDLDRPQIKAMGKAYDGSCRHRQTAPAGACAIRVRTESTEIAFEDLIQGHYQQNVNKEVGDFVVRRKDNLFAYQLAVVADDEWQNITHCVRGFDLIDSTPRQIYLQKLLNYSTPSYAHIPIITDALGQKLSKQAFAPSINTNSSAQLIFQALTVLGQAPPTELKLESPQQQLRWAIGNWDIRRVPKLANIKQESPP